MTTARVIDFETTGTPEEEHAEVIEMARYDLDLASIEVDGGTWTYDVGNPWSSLCCPRGPIPAVAKAVHHITEADCADAPQARELWDQFFDGIGSADVIAAHNAKFEQHFCPDTGASWICTYKVSRVVWPDAPTHSNQGLRYWLNLPVDPLRATPPHRALPDAYVTAHLLARLLAEKTIEEMIHISKYPALLKIMNFGKHKGTTFEAAPIDYLEWIRDKSEMDEDTKFSAGYWIKKRRAAA